MYKKNLVRALIPFWIYWGILVMGCVLFFICPLILFLILPAALICVVIWAAVVYLVGGAVQKRTGLKKVRERAGVSFVCSLMTVMIFPVCALIDNYIKWGHIYLASFFKGCTDVSFLVVSALHFFVFWIGEEIQRAETKEDTGK